MSLRPARQTERIGEGEEEVEVEEVERRPSRQRRRQQLKGAPARRCVGAPAELALMKRLGRGACIELKEQASGVEKKEEAAAARGGEERDCMASLRIFFR